MILFGFKIFNLMEIKRRKKKESFLLLYLIDLPNKSKNKYEPLNEISFGKNTEVFKVKKKLTFSPNKQKKVAGHILIFVIDYA